MREIAGCRLCAEEDRVGGIAHIHDAEEAIIHMCSIEDVVPVSYTHLRAHETVLDLVCRLLLEKKNQQQRERTHAVNLPHNKH